MPRSRWLPAIPRGHIVTPFPLGTIAPPTVTPRYVRIPARVLSSRRGSVASPPFNPAAVITSAVIPNGTRVTVRKVYAARRGSIVTPVFPTSTPPAPAPMVPDFHRNARLSLRGLRTGNINTVLPNQVGPAILPEPPEGTDSRDRLHWWRNRTD